MKTYMPVVPPSSGPGWLASTQADLRRIDPKAYLEHVKYLASDDLEGRGNGTPGLEAAAEYIAQQFRDAGLEPAGDNGTFFQTFEMTTGLSVEPGNIVTIQAGRSVGRLRDRPRLRAGLDPRRSVGVHPPLPLVFAGYGISAPAMRYDDYAGIDANGKAVLIFTHEPQENDARSAFEGQTNTIHSTMMRKVGSGAETRGAGRSSWSTTPTTGRRPTGSAAGCASRRPKILDFRCSTCRVTACSGRSEQG